MGRRTQIIFFCSVLTAAWGWGRAAAQSAHEPVRAGSARVLEADSAAQSVFFDGAKRRRSSGSVAAGVNKTIPGARPPTSAPTGSAGAPESGGGAAVPAPAEDDASIWARGFQAIYKTLEKNFLPYNLRYSFARPSPSYPGIFLWDSAFIAEVWRLKDAAVAEEVLLAPLRGQRSNGRVPQVRGLLTMSSLSNPPLLSWSAMRVYRQNGDKVFLAKIYEPLKRFRAWYYANRRLDNGLFYWKHPYESGLDNSPRFSNRSESKFDDTTKIMAVDLASYLVLDGENMAEMALVLERSEEAQNFRREADELKALINARLWDAESGFYFDRRTDGGEFVRVRSIASLMPLVAGIPSQEQADIVVRHILDPNQFNTPTPFPSVARSDANFEKDCWRGPVWVNMGYLTVLGMQRYGYDVQSRELAYRLADGVYKTWARTGKFVEFYDPDRNDLKELTRKKGNLFKRITLGSKPVDNFVGWTGLVNNLVLEHTGTPDHPLALKAPKSAGP